MGALFAPERTWQDPCRTSQAGFPGSDRSDATGIFQKLLNGMQIVREEENTSRSRQFS